MHSTSQELFMSGILILNYSLPLSTEEEDFRPWDILPED
jgi:hypothetical protein